MLTEDRTQITGEIDSADQGAVNLSLLQGANPDLQGAQPRVLFAGDGETRAADTKLFGDAAGDNAAEGAHRPVGGQGRADGSAQLRHPITHLQWRQLQVELLCPELRLALHRPADAEIGSIEIKTGTDKDAGEKEFFLLQPGIL